MKKKIITPVVAVVAALAIPAAASASTTFDPTCSLTKSNSSGICGFVGKGDLQVPWTWSNQTLQAEALANDITFAYNETDSATYDVTCQFTVGGPNPVPITINHRAPVNDAVQESVTGGNRKNPQLSVTGFYLTGEGTPTTSGDTPPVVNDPCPGNSNLGLVTAVSAPYNQSSSSELDASDVTAGTGPTAIWLNGVSVN